NNFETAPNAFVSGLVVTLDKPDVGNELGGFFALDPSDLTPVYFAPAAGVSALPEGLEETSTIDVTINAIKNVSGMPMVVTYTGLTVTGSVESLDEVVQSLPNVSYSTLERDVGRVLTALVRARHLAPVYGENTQILPLPEDPLVIEDVPDVFQTGHIHRVANLSYHGVQLVNTGAWQEQTEYQRLLGIEPSIGTCVLVELSSLRVSVRFFT
ncbi:MAG: hypothetical protein QXD32_03610, partial [Nitrososphaerota archaeon]